VHPVQAAAFERAYGAAGPWAKLFALHPGFERTRLFRHKEDSHVYVTLDVWRSRADYDSFKASYADEYRRLDEQFAPLKLEETLLGFYEGFTPGTRSAGGATSA
jgi:heme-degrading monooxygenase HmoA